MSKHNQKLKYWTIALFLFAFSMAGCASGAKQSYLDTALNTWLGTTEDDLIGRFGPPDGVYTTEKSKYLTYVMGKDTQITSGTAPTYITGQYGKYAYTTPVGGTSAKTVQRYCKITFTLTDNEVTAWRYEGNKCKAKRRNNLSYKGNENKVK